MQALQTQGVQALSLPALQLSLREEARQQWVSPASYDLLVFVSGYAAQCYLQCWQLGQGSGPLVWPAHTLAATVGAASARPLREALALSERQLIHPPADMPQDSESLWQILAADVVSAQRVLIVGAPEGRDWLRQRFLERGCQVDRYAVYERRAASWSQLDIAPVRQALQDGRPVLALLTSSQGVDALDDNLHALDLTKFYASARLLTIHPRIASRLQWQAQRAGCDEPLVELCTPDDAAILDALLRMLAR